MVVAKITDHGKYDLLVRRVETDDLKTMSPEVFTGSITIVKKDGGFVPFFGHIEADYFEKDFGFRLEAQTATILTC